VVPQLLVSKAKIITLENEICFVSLLFSIPCRNASEGLNKNHTEPSEFGVCLVQPPIAVGLWIK